MSSSRSQQTTKNCSTHSVPVLVHTLANISSRNPEPKIVLSIIKPVARKAGAPFTPEKYLKASQNVGVRHAWIRSIVGLRAHVTVLLRKAKDSGLRGF